MQNGYPFRLPHAEFRAQFHMLVSGLQVDKRILFDAEACAAFLSDPARPFIFSRSGPHSMERYTDDQVSLPP